jgi:integrase/recombinase XerD
MRRALGFKLESHGPRLMSFVRFCEDRDATTVTTDLAVEWATSTASDHEAYQARRLDVVRIFARHLQPLDPATEVPPGDVLDRRQWRIPPYLYSPSEVTALMSQERQRRRSGRRCRWRCSGPGPAPPCGAGSGAPRAGLPLGRPARPRRPRPDDTGDLGGFLA